MKVIVIAALLALATANDWNLFNDFLVKYEKKYDSMAEMEQRFTIFKQNLVNIARMNAEHIAAGGGAIYGVNSLADLSTEEFRATRLMKNLTYRAPAPVVPAPPMPLTNVDWRTKGVVTAVKDQGNCGSCWAHSADEATESFDALKHGKLQTLSVQQCTACTYAYDGCEGGWPHDAYVSAIQKRNGIDTDANYPYNIAQAGNCRFGATGPADAPVADDQASGTPFVSPAQGQMQAVLNNNGPLSVCVAAESWQYYTGGIMTVCTGSVDHCVQTVGYTQDGVPESYWVVRNSWGTGWGYQGYIYLDMTANNGDICHIQEYMTYPIMQ